jgi:ZIP family zinc transporter
MIENLKFWFVNQNPIYQALLAGVFTWVVTAIGSGLVFFFNSSNRKFLDISLGFTGGVMIAASFWSLLSPSIEYVEMQKEMGLTKMPSWLAPTIGFFFGALFLFALDKIIPHLHMFDKKNHAEGFNTKWQKTILLVLAIAMHNIPEGLAVGVAFGAIVSPEILNNLNGDIFTLGSAVALAIGIGIQNFPEGIAVSMPMRRQGVSKLKSFWYGQLSAIVEPIAAVVGAVAVTFFTPLLPYAMAFAAGAMIFVVVEEVIPETQQDDYTDVSTLGFILGFIVMMTLDVSLG